MKMKQEHYQHLESEINKVLELHNKHGELVDCYESGNFHKADRVQDLQKRFCFDVLYGCSLSRWICDELYPYLDDEHIYTALKRLCPTVTLRRFKDGT